MDKLVLTVGYLHRVFNTKRCHMHDIQILCSSVHKARSLLWGGAPQLEGSPLLGKLQPYPKNNGLVCKDTILL